MATSADILQLSQNALEDHFSRLAQARGQRGIGVFALEHGLTPAQLEPIFNALRARLRLGERLSPHWLLWTVYAAELGYDYDGSEFWTSFEKRTKYWDVRGDRSYIRRWFIKFQAAYGGIKPQGKWAGWFSIIAWPITHAVLPRDLQSQLASALYEQRYRLAAMPLDSALSIGKFLSRHTSEASSRFRNFLEQEELVGRIVLALLSGESDERNGDLLAATLNRIVSDLERTRNAREWLHDTRRVIEKTRLRGLGPAGGSPRSPDLVGKGEEPRQQPPSKRPALLLQRTVPGVWLPLLSLPNLSQLAALTTDLKSYLRSTRVSVTGTEGWKPAAWLLSGPHKVVLKSWPQPGEPLLNFERPNRLMDHLVKSDACMSRRSTLIFKVGVDGLARELEDPLVRPGSSYVLLHSTALPFYQAFKASSVVGVSISATELQVPETVSKELETVINRAGLRVAKSLRIWPAGLPARRWDGEGNAEWMSNEDVFLGVHVDHPVDGIRVEIPGSSPAILRSPSVARPHFLSLGQLPVGTHLLHMTAVEGFGSLARAVSEGTLRLHIRAPDPWRPGTTSHCGLVVSCEPSEPTLDEFWTGEVQLTALGPEGGKACLTLELLGGSDEVMKSEPIANLNLPIASHVWGKEYLSAVKDWQLRDPWSYLSASHARLVIDGDELGRFIVPLRREVAPLRWVSNKTATSMELRLLDDTGTTGSTVQFFEFRRPTVSVESNGSDFKKAKVIDWPGGLYVASGRDLSSSLIVSLPKIEGSLAGLSLPVDRNSLPRDQRAALRIIEVAEVWSSAMLSGPLATQRRDHVLKYLNHHLFELLGGGRWAHAEESYEARPKAPAATETLEAEIGKPLSYGIAIGRACYDICCGEPSARIGRFFEIASAFSVTKERDLCEAALRLAANPQRFRLWAGADCASWIERLKQSGMLVRAARFISIVGAIDDPTLLGPLARGWDK